MLSVAPELQSNEKQEQLPPLACPKCGQEITLTESKTVYGLRGGSLDLLIDNPTKLFHCPTCKITLIIDDAEIPKIILLS